MRPIRATWTLQAAVLLGLAMSLGGAGCSDAEPPPNRAPSIRLLVGPPENGSVSYRVPLSWEGSDPDGRVVRYELLVDPDPRFSELEIARPDTFGLPVDIVDGTTRVTKTIPGQTPAVLTWEHRVDRHTVLTLAADELDDLTLPSGRPSFARPHRVYVRAVDDQGAVSRPERVAFTARSLAPTTFMRYPVTPATPWKPSVLLVPAGTRLLPGATDADSPGVIGYLLRAVPMCSDPQPGDPLPHVHELFPDEGVEDWTFHPADPEGLLVPVPECGIFSPADAYAVAFRAVDEAGAYDPFLEWGRNVVPLLDRKSTGITLRMELPGSRCRDGDRILSLDGRTPRVTATAAADPEGVPLEIRHGLDVVTDADPGWSEWTPGDRLSLPPMTLDGPGVHVLSLQARNRFDIRTAVRLEIEVAPDLPRGSTVLLVDDHQDGSRDADAVRDAFWRDRLLAAGIDPSDLVVRSTHGEGDALYLDPRPLGPEDLLPHRAVIWSVRGTGFSRRTGLSHTVCTGALDLYRAGGAPLWVVGEASVAATLPDDQGDGAFYPIGLLAGDFAWDALHLHAPEVRNAGTANRRDHGLVEVDPYPGGAAGWPGLVRDEDKLPEELRGFGLGDCDAVFGPLADGAGILEPVYVYGAHGPRRLDRPSPFEGRVTGTRWHDPDPAPAEGRAVWFGFPLAPFRDAEAQTVVDAVLAWFDETPPGP